MLRLAELQAQRFQLPPTSEVLEQTAADEARGAGDEGNLAGDIE